MANENKETLGNRDTIERDQQRSQLTKLINGKYKDKRECNENYQENVPASISDTQACLRREIDSNLSLSSEQMKVIPKGLTGVELRQNIKNQYINIYKLNSDQFAKSKVILDSYCVGSKRNSLVGDSTIDFSELTGDELKHAIREQYVNIYRLDDRQFMLSKMKLDKVLDQTPDNHVRQVIIKSSSSRVDNKQTMKETEDSSKNTNENISEKEVDKIDICSSSSSPYNLVLEENTKLESSLPSKSRVSIDNTSGSSLTNNEHKNCDSTYRNAMDAIDMFTPRAVDVNKDSLFGPETIFSKSKLVNIFRPPTKMDTRFHERNSNDQNEPKLTESQMSQGDAVGTNSVPIESSISESKEAVEYKEITMLQAITNKYEECGTNIYLPKTPRKTDSGRIRLPKALTMDSRNISHAGDDLLEATVKENVIEVDLSSNKFQYWNEIITVTRAFLNLNFINISRNPLMIYDIESGTEFPKMHKLIMNNIGFKYDKLPAILKLFPNLHELHLSLNDLSKFDVSANIKYESLEILHINQAKIIDYQIIRKFGNLFPSINQLCMIDNPISIIAMENCCDSFKILTHLNISGTKLNSWIELESLNCLEKLQSLKLKGIPLLKNLTDDNKRLMPIAKLANISMLNGSEISKKERNSALELI